MFGWMAEPKGGAPCRSLSHITSWLWFPSFVIFFSMPLPLHSRSRKKIKRSVLPRRYYSSKKNNQATKLYTEKTNEPRKEKEQFLEEEPSPRAIRSCTFYRHFKWLLDWTRSVVEFKETRKNCLECHPLSSSLVFSDQWNFPLPPTKDKKKEEKRRDEELRVNASEREDGPHLFVGIRGVPSIFSFINLFL